MCFNITRNYAARLQLARARARQIIRPTIKTIYRQATAISPTPYRHLCSIGDLSSRFCLPKTRFSVPFPLPSPLVPPFPHSPVNKKENASGNAMIDRLEAESVANSLGEKRKKEERFETVLGNLIFGRIPDPGARSGRRFFFFSPPPPPLPPISRAG